MIETTTRTVVKNFSVDEWENLQLAIKASCELNDPSVKIKDRAKKRSAGACKCGACTLKKDSRILSYLIYWHRNREMLLAQEGLLDD